MFDMGVEDRVIVAFFCFVFALVIASAFLYENIELMIKTYMYYIQ